VKPSRIVSPGRVPVRHSLVTRLLATSVLIAIAAITATAWLATRTATRAIRQEQGQSLTDDKGVYDMLVGYAATHPDWSGARVLIDERAAQLGRRITLTTADRNVIIDSAAGPSLRAARPSATVDALDLDLGLTGGAERIDDRAVGPFLLPAAERAAYRKPIADVVGCLAKSGIGTKVVDGPTGRPTVQLTTDDQKGTFTACNELAADFATKTESTALTSLAQLTGRCLGLPATHRLIIRTDWRMYVLPVQKGPPTPAPAEQLAPAAEPDAAALTRMNSCLEKSRRTQLQPYVAPPALLFVTEPGDGDDSTTFTLSRDNTIRIVGVTAAVLLATIVITVLVGRRLVRPLRALTEAADHQAPAPVTGRDEIGRLARALNDSALRRDQAEAQRRAMVSDVAHELRTPLTNIRSWLEAAQDDLAPTDAQLVALLHDEAVQLQHIIEDLTDLAAIDAGTLRVHPEPAYVRDLLAQVTESQRGTAQAAGVRLDLDVHGEPVIDADPVRIRQLVGNLVSNAIRYTPPGGAVTVSARDTTIAVADTGVGIAPEDLPRVFDRFWRADLSRSRATGGSGLGLAIARKLVEAHDGTITVASTPGVGSVFTVSLPGAASTR
jgi:two-component system sensor histidine kinase BaeS